ncbi:hypothetical protein JHD46_05160 [Sulfurimonas sp. SAG-AH-194-C20]|nr:hypothetical protein [Sulfurimonas sp. SAG-AH-194-C20]MDF1879027.1 hypothetical protein [Sulfurimonas sp. SAG-AH-194-C20]
MPFHQYEDSWNESASETLSRIEQEREESENSNECGIICEIEEYVSEKIDQVYDYFEDK